MNTLHEDHEAVRPGRGRDRDMPLLVGLMESASRRSIESPLALNGNGHSVPLGDEEAFLQELAQKRTAGGGMLDSVANMANSILGAGIIGAQLSPTCPLFSPHRSYAGLPYAVSQAGFFTGLFLLVVLSGVTDWTIRLIVINAKLSGRHSYIDIMDKCFGPSGRAAVSFFQFAFAFGGGVKRFIRELSELTIGVYRHVCLRCNHR